jgi:hypothetical protein
MNLFTFFQSILLDPRLLSLQVPINARALVQ